MQQFKLFNKIILVRYTCVYNHYSLCVYRHTLQSGRSRNAPVNAEIALRSAVTTPYYTVKKRIEVIKVKYIKQDRTAFSAHGHWNTIHTVSITLNDALDILNLIDSVYPNAFTHEGTNWKFGNVIYENLPNTNLQSIVMTLETILNSKP